MTLRFGEPQGGGRSAPVASKVGGAFATLVGGVFGDPLLHVRLRYQKQSLLFDLGDTARLAARAAHQVSAVFLSHAHIDHIGGFLWFLRSRIGHLETCKVFGPAETIKRIEGFIGGVTWDRIEENGPVFEVCELDNLRLRRARLKPGKARVELEDMPVTGGAILAEENFTVRAVVCDHHTPSVAYAFQSSREINVRKEKLAGLGLAPGPWLGKLKKCIVAGTLDAGITLPDGVVRTAGELAEELVLVRPGNKLAYATDVADTPENREKLIALAEGAHTFFCEAGFLAKDSGKARATQHLTTLGAVEIARAAGVKRLAPFHFSKRYEHDPMPLYEEMLGAAGPLKILGVPVKNR
ncbi:MBL fold metallo-hydrolase [bacterium]|nr:MAG: MBL fold metallo-hydrolase [bacterium]